VRADFLTPSPGIARAARNGLAVLLLGIVPATACLIIGIGLFTHSLGHAPLFDFHGGDWFAAKRILAGRTPYELDYLRHRADLIANGGHPDPNIAVPAYPAPALLAMVPFGLLSYTAAAVVFLLLATAAAVGSLWVVGVRDWRCYGALFLSYPVIHGLALGALTSTLMLLTALAWRYRERAVFAGSFAAAAIVLKLFLWPLLAWLVITRRTQAAAIAVAASAAACVAGWAVIGFAGLASYPEMLSLLSRTQERATYSVASLLAALGAASAPAQAAGTALGVALIAAAWRNARGGGSEPLVLALCLAASFAASPILWSHYFALLYVPIAIAAPRLRAIWLAPALLWPPADPASATWQIAVYLVAAAAVTAWVVIAARRMPTTPVGAV
jgi:hypothetical protein